MYLKYKPNIFKVLSITCVLLLTTSCGSESVSYVTRDSLKYDPIYEQSRSDYRPKHYGALKFQEKYDSEDEGRLFVFHKNKGAYEAETFFRENNQKRYYVSLGVNYRNKAPMVGLRVEY